ncbi:MAG TPA: twin-arginine translocase TatA/TatE family subunit [Chthonomonadaceae bacterium]|nr:twin-arginine translocase TatA/TatE family subunit [Chthonomonadaceae bacterium]
MLAFIDNPIGIAAIFILALLLFGPDKLPQIAGQLGRALRELRRTASDLKSSWDVDDHYEPPRYDNYPYNGDVSSAASVPEVGNGQASSAATQTPAALSAGETPRGDFAAAALADTSADYGAGPAAPVAETDSVAVPQEPLRPQPAEGTVPRSR